MILWWRGNFITALLWALSRDALMPGACQHVFKGAEEGPPYGWGCATRPRGLPSACMALLNTTSWAAKTHQPTAWSLPSISELCSGLLSAVRLSSCPNGLIHKNICEDFDVHKDILVSTKAGLKLEFLQMHWNGGLYCMVCLLVVMFLFCFVFFLLVLKTWFLRVVAFSCGHICSSPLKPALVVDQKRRLVIRGQFSKSLHWKYWHHSI